MKLGLLLELPDQRENVELAARAEAAGFDSVWAPEFHNHSGPLALAGAALETDSVELGTSIAWAFGRSPLLTAVTALDLDEMSGGRFVLGLGTGTRRMRTDWLGAPGERPARRLRETVEAIRAVWAAAEAGAVEYEGELVRLACGPMAAPARSARRSRSILAAVNEGMARTAGAVADGVVSHPMATVRYIDEVMRPAIAEGAGQEGRSPATSRSPTGCWSRSPTTRTRRARTRSARSPSTRPSGPTTGILDLHGFTEAAAQIRELWRSFDLAGMTALVTDEMLDAMAVAGTPDECRERVAERAQSADRLLLGAPVVATDPGRMREYHDAIVETFGARRFDRT